MTLDAWREIRKTADDILYEPQGPERIARCEAFLKEHPDYPEPRGILRTLAEDTLEMGTYDPARVAEWIEESVRPGPGEDDFGMSPQWTLERFYFKYGLPMESARRLLKWSREALERNRRKAERGEDPFRREASWLEPFEFRLGVDEGRILLAEGNAAAALKKLREAEARGRLNGQILVLRDPAGGEVVELPAGNTAADWLHYSMAEAYSRLGDRAAAVDQLDRVRNFGGSSDELTGAVENLREKLNLPAAALTEVRAAPRPAPDFTLEDLAGEKVSLSDFRGKVVLVILWSSG